MLRGNLKALKNIYFFPSMNERLQPKLDEAIREAEGKPPIIQ
jgi:hypothetical protein